jgi:hypothetical protein
MVKPSKGRCLALAQDSALSFFWVVGWRGLLMALMMEAARTSETLVNFYQTAWRYNPEDSHVRASLCFLLS